MLIIIYNTDKISPFLGSITSFWAITYLNVGINTGIIKDHSISFIFLILHFSRFIASNRFLSCNPSSPPKKSIAL